MTKPCEEGAGQGWMPSARLPLLARLSSVLIYDSSGTVHGFPTGHTGDSPDQGVQAAVLLQC